MSLLCISREQKGMRSYIMSLKKKHFSIRVPLKRCSGHMQQKQCCKATLLISYLGVGVLL